MEIIAVEMNLPDRIPGGTAQEDVSEGDAKGLWTISVRMQREIDRRSRATRGRGADPVRIYRFSQASKELPQKVQSSGVA